MIRSIIFLLVVNSFGSYTCLWETYKEVYCRMQVSSFLELYNFREAETCLGIKYMTVAEHVIQLVTELVFCFHVYMCS